MSKKNKHKLIDNSIEQILENTMEDIQEDAVEQVAEDRIEEDEIVEPIKTATPQKRSSSRRRIIY